MSELPERWDAQLKPILVRSDAAEACNEGHRLCRQGDWEPAIASLSEAILIHPDYARAYLERGMAHYARGDLDRTIEDLSEVIRLKAGSAEVYCARGVVADKAGDAESAIADYTEAIRLEPDLVSAWYQRGLARLALGELELAIADFNESLRLDPNTPAALEGRCRAYKRQGNCQKAEEDEARLRDCPRTSMRPIRKAEDVDPQPQDRQEPQQ